jgi:dienelactone hydrolase
MSISGKNFKNPWLFVSIALFIISAFGASLVQSGGGSIIIKDLRWETASGHMLSALLFKPKNATPEKPAPAIITTHGILNSREMQDAAYTELSRRGYVVLAIDLYAHGFSETVTGPERDKTIGTGVYDAVELAAELPYVDKTKIGITGHSFGGRSCNWAIEYDNTLAKPLIASVFLQCADANYTEGTDKPGATSPDKGKAKFVNMYGSRDTGIIAASYDEFFHRMQKPDGTISKPREFLETLNAQSFLNFGEDPAKLIEKREANKQYTQSIGGKNTTRIIYTLENATHPWAHFSGTAAGYIVDFFEHSFGAPNPIPSTSQIWQFKEFLNMLGIIAFGIFLVSFTKLLIAKEYYKPLACPAREAKLLTYPIAKVWLWSGLVISAVFATVTYVVLYNPVQTLQPGFRQQYAPLFIGIWSAVNGAFVLIFMFVYYKIQGKKSGFDPKADGLLIPKRNIWLTIVLSFHVTIVAYLIVFAAQYLFNADFRIWVLAIKSFSADHIPNIIKMFPLFALYYIGNSMAVNTFDRFTVLGKEWINTAILGFFNCLCGIAVLLMQYVVFYSTGEMNPMIQALAGIFMYPIVIILFTSAVISRKIYRVTNNPYIGGLINSIVITIINVANTQNLTY